MSIGTSYKQHGIRGSYDVIVIGSGIGGLGVAALLAKHAGKRVLVLERHYTAGGYTHVFRRPGYEWDVGVHYIGQMGERSLMRRVFDEISDETLEWADMGEVYDRILIGEDSYDLVKGRQRFRDRLCEYFPDEVSAIDSYLELVREAVRATRSFFAERALPNAVSAVLGPILRSGMSRFARRTTWDVLSELTDNPRLIAVLTGQFGDYGLPPKQSSFIMQAMVANHYFEGGYYPVGGSSRIAETIVPVIEDRGGAVMICADVAQILMVKGKAVGVRLADGEEVRAPMVISDAGVHTTLNQLLPEENRLAAKSNRVDASAAHACLYVGLKGTTEELGLNRPNLWVYPSDDYDGNIQRFLDDPEAPLPLVFLSFPSAKDPSFHDRYPGHSTIEAITLAPYEWFAKWEDDRWHKRGEDYESLKQKFTDRLLRALLKQCPQLSSAIDHAELSTPVTTRHFTNFAAGEIYGLEHSPERFAQRWLRPRTPIPGLFLTGADVCTAGVGGALFGAVLSASAITGKNLLTKIADRRRIPQRSLRAKRPARPA